MNRYVILPIVLFVLILGFTGCKKESSAGSEIVYTEVVKPAKPKLDQSLEVSGVVKGGEVYNIFTNDQVRVTKQFAYKGQKVAEGKKLLECLQIKDNAPGTNVVINADGNGVITEIAEVGSVYTITTEKPLVCITDLSKLEVEAKVTESNISKIKVGLPVDIRSDATDEVLKGKVSRIAYMADPDGDKGTYVNIFISFNNKNEVLMPNFNVYLTINYNLQNNALMLPKIAIMNEDGKSFIYTLDKDNVVHKKFVETGMSTDLETQVIGIGPDIKVIKNISPAIKDGVKLEAKQLIFK